MKKIIFKAHEVQQLPPRQSLDMKRFNSFAIVTWNRLWGRYL